MCLCQFLGWIDDKKKYHCIYHQIETYSDATDRQYTPILPDHIHVHHLPDEIHVHHFHKVHWYNNNGSPNDINNSKQPLSITRIDGIHKVSPFEHFTEYDNNFVQKRKYNPIANANIMKKICIIMMKCMNLKIII